MSPLVCTDSLEKQDFPVAGSSMQEPSQRVPREHSEETNGQEDADSGSTAEDSKAEEIRHVGSRHLGLPLDGFMDTHVHIEGPWGYLPGGHHSINLSGCIESATSIDFYTSSVLGLPATSGCVEKDNKELVFGRYLEQPPNFDPNIEGYLSFPWEEFRLQRPNGTHQCSIYLVRGPAIDEPRGHVEDPNVYLLKLTRQVALAIAVLHRHNICHGDFRPSNILIENGGLEGKQEEELGEVLGEPDGKNVIMYKHDTSAKLPPYPNYSLDGSTPTQLFCQCLSVTDFGLSLTPWNPPPHGSGISFHYAAPEVALDEGAGKESDIWALAATMYEIRFGRSLFHCPGYNVEAYVYPIVKYCGKLPEPWWRRWSETWNQARESKRFHSGPADERQIEDEGIARRCYMREAVGEKVGHSITSPEPIRKCEEPRCESIWHEHIPEEEQDLFADLLYKMTELSPEKRLTIGEVLEHPWFSYGVEESVPFRAGNSKKVAVDMSEEELVEREVFGSDEVDKPEIMDVDEPQTPVIDKPQFNAAETPLQGTNMIPKLLDDAKLRAVTLEIPKLPATNKPELGAHGTPLPTQESRHIISSAHLSPVAEVNESQDLETEDFHSVKAVKSVPSPAETREAEDSGFPAVSANEPKPLRENKRAAKARKHRTISTWLRSVGRAFRHVFA
ncbi:kinase-like domain-containing protein [Aspergillus desertorum]